MSKHEHLAHSNAVPKFSLTVQLAWLSLVYVALIKITRTSSSIIWSDFNKNNKYSDSKLSLKIIQQVALPEASCPGVVVIVDVGDWDGEPNDAGSIRVVIDSSGHTEGCLLLDITTPAVTETTLSDAQNWTETLVAPNCKVLSDLSPYQVNIKWNIKVIKIIF